MRRVFHRSSGEGVVKGRAFDMRGDEIAPGRHQEIGEME
jgi:hypothetical protein